MPSSYLADILPASRVETGLLRLARRLGQAFAAYFFNSAVQLVTSVIGCRSAARLFGTLRVVIEVERRMSLRE